MTDSKLEAVVRNWLPRFLANELDYLDIQRTLARIERWEQWTEAWSGLAGEYRERGEEALAAGHRVTAGAHLRRAALTLQFGQFVATEDEKLRERLHRQQVATYERAAPLLLPPAERVDMQAGTFTVAGYFRAPSHHDPIGVVLLVPGLESTKEQFTTFEPHFLCRGIATLSVEGPGQGETWYQRPFRDAEYGAALRTAAQFLDRRCPAARRVLLGASFGGYLALRHAAVVPHLAGAVDLAGPYDLADYDDLQPVTKESLRHFVQTDDDAQARDVLADVDLTAALDELIAPVLVVHGTLDRIIVPQHADRIARALGEQATFWKIEGGNHGCNNCHTWIRPAVADWVADRLRESGSAMQPIAFDGPRGTPAVGTIDGRDQGP